MKTKDEYEIILAELETKMLESIYNYYKIEGEFKMNHSAKYKVGQVVICCGYLNIYQTPFEITEVSYGYNTKKSFVKYTCIELTKSFKPSKKVEIFNFDEKQIVGVFDVIPKKYTNRKQVTLCDDTYYNFIKYRDKLQEEAFDD